MIAHGHVKAEPDRAGQPSHLLQQQMLSMSLTLPVLCSRPDPLSIAQHLQPPTTLSPTCCSLPHRCEGTVHTLT